MTRTRPGAPWRAATAVAASFALLFSAATSASADELAPMPLPSPGDFRTATDDPFAPFRADPELTAPQRLGETGLDRTSATAGTGSISGKLTYTDMTEVPLRALGTGYVEVQQWNEATSSFDLVASTEATDTGAYSVTGVPAGTYHVAFFDLTPGTPLLPEFWKDAPRSGMATTVTLTEGQVVTGIDEPLEPLLTGYIAGIDRYATSIAISKSGFAPDVPCVYIASGAAFPDALSAGPAAAACGGPLLLVPPTNLPSQIASELKRLSPGKIVIAGGTGAVSAAVESKLKAIAPTKRISGKDRYETSRKIVADAFDQVPAIWVATGRDFPDALAASAAGAVDGLPVLIIDGISARPNLFLTEVLLQTGAKTVAIAGGTGVVSAQHAKAMDSQPGVSVIRLAGADRYQTALKINELVWDPSQWSSVYAFLVTGTKFPDALSGAPLAGAYGAPMHVVPPTCTPAGVAKNITALDVHEAYLLGHFSKLSFNGKPFKVC
ncbi:cell wall-binding repeat-containing protein [Agromyces italicus]|uniref:cell wall-binding repeat-containing protein n=1 Tax=Agromyces italicus TaxID=279572 RepID=UPI00146A498F|nr:cell wall-binding repeat-containing protein [Agromyces italicus]